MKIKLLLLLALLQIFLVAGSTAYGQSLLPNIDFEYGNLTNWTCYMGACCTGGIMSFPAITLPVNGRHNIMTGSDTDHYGGFPIVAPGGGSYSCRIGYDTTPNRAEKIRYYVHIPTGTSDYSLVYHYAVVLENASFHSPTQEPRMEITAIDSSTGLLLPCNSINLVAGSLSPGFISSAMPSRVSGNGADVTYKPWSTGTMHFTGLNGHTIAIDFAAGDCSLGAHFGYGYVDMSAGLISSLLMLPCSSTSVTLIGPAGYTSYRWSDSSTFGTVLDTTQIVTIPAPLVTTTYAVIVTPYAGFGCQDTFYTTVFRGGCWLSISSDQGNYVCAGTTVSCTPATVINGGTSPVFMWYKNGVFVSTGVPFTFTPVTGDVVYCRMTSVDTCTLLPDSANSNSIVFTADPSGNPTVNITADPGDTICPGHSATCYTTATVGGTAPFYQWFKNGAPAYFGTPYTFAPANGDAVYCIMTSNSACATSPTDTSNTITFTYVPVVHDSVTFTISPTDILCMGTTVTLTATSINGDPSPRIDWYLNNVNVNTGNPYSFSPTGSAAIYCKMTGSSCTALPVKSVTKNIVVKPNPIPSLTISATPGTEICPDMPVTCTAYPVNGGPAPIFEWFQNSVNVYTGNPFTLTPANGDSLYCRLTSNAECVATPTVVSTNRFAFQIDPAPSVVIGCTPGPVNIRGASVTLTAYVSATNSDIQLQWYKNGIAIPGATNYSYTSNDFSFRDSVYCTIAESGTCLGNASSNTLVIETYHDMRLYPNPNNGNFAISGDNYNANSNPVSMAIFTAAGKLVCENTAAFDAISFHAEINMARQLPPGVYILKLQYSLEKLNFFFVIN